MLALLTNVKVLTATNLLLRMPCLELSRLLGLARLSEDLLLRRATFHGGGRPTLATRTLGQLLMRWVEAVLVRARSIAAMRSAIRREKAIAARVELLRLRL